MGAAHGPGNRKLRATTTGIKAPIRQSLTRRGLKSLIRANANRKTILILRRRYALASGPPPPDLGAMDTKAPRTPITIDLPARDDSGVLNERDLAALTRAVEALERTSFAARLSSMLGGSVALAGKLVPARITAVASRAASIALKAATRVALRSLRNTPPRDSRMMHSAMAGASGAVGGVIGLASLPVELPVSTTMMLRSIADIARAEGEDLSQPEAALACLEVFALGGHGTGPELLDGGYFAVRGLLAKSVTEAARYVAQRRVIDESAPALVKLMAQIAARFGLVVSQKALAQALPVIGAVGGAAVNIAFMQHFQALAHGHFTVRRLERTYGVDVVRPQYEKLAKLRMPAVEAAPPT